MKARKGAQEIAIIVALLLLCIYVFVSAGAFKGESGMFPRIVSGLTGVLCLLELGVQVRAWQAVSAEPCPAAPGSGGTNRGLFIASLALACYVALIFIIGYYLATLIYLCASIFLFGYQKKWVILLIVAGMLAFIYFLFSILLYVRLPSGLLF